MLRSPNKLSLRVILQRNQPPHVLLASASRCECYVRFSRWIHLHLRHKFMTLFARLEMSFPKQRSRWAVLQQRHSRLVSLRVARTAYINVARPVHSHRRRTIRIARRSIVTRDPQFRPVGGIFDRGEIQRLLRAHRSPRHVHLAGGIHQHRHGVVGALIVRPGPVVSRDPQLRSLRCVLDRRVIRVVATREPVRKTCHINVTLAVHHHRQRHVNRSRAGIARLPKPGAIGVVLHRPVRVGIHVVVRRTGDVNAPTNVHR